MWLPNNIIAEVGRVARIHYVDRAMCVRWNEHRKEGELRLLTGWCWTARNGRDYRQGFKTQTVAYRDAYYALVRQEHTPPIARPRLRVVSDRAVA
jgi:hypothetical protein